MSLQIEQREIDGITILVLQGDLILGSEATSLHDDIPQLIEEGKIKVILNLQAVPYIDSTGLGVLISAHSGFRNAGGALKLVHLSQKNLELLILSKLNFVFETFNDEQAAINSFFPDREVKRFDILQFVQSQENTDHEQDSSASSDDVEDARLDETTASVEQPEVRK